MSGSDGKGFPFAKIVVVLAVAFCVGLGLCGLDYLLAANGIGKSGEEFGVGPLDGVSLIVMILSGFGLVVAVIIWIIAAILGRLGLGRVSDEPQSLFEDKDDQDNLG
jgi:hypothetical protein